MFSLKLAHVHYVLLHYQMTLNKVESNLKVPDIHTCRLHYIQAYATGLKNEKYTDMGACSYPFTSCRVGVIKAVL